MKLSITQKRKVRTAFKITLAGIIISLLYPVFNDDYTDFTSFMNALTVGVVGGVTFAILEVQVFYSWKPGTSFIKAMMFKTIVYFVIFALLIPGCVLMCESILEGRSLSEQYYSEEFQSFLYKEDFEFILFYAFIFIGIVIFVLQINRKLGQGILVNYISGKYDQPQEVERIIMHMDIRSSSSIAEKLGEIQYHNFLHDFFQHITDCILATKGAIYSYVGDQVIVTWEMSSGLDQANCIQTYFCAKNRIKSLREKYLHKYGLVPRFSTSLHSGKVIIGELGHIKSQIVYQGEVMYQTTAIERKFRNLELEEDILISGTLIEQIKLPSLYRASRVAEINDLDDSPIDVYTLRQEVLASN